MHNIYTNILLCTLRVWGFRGFQLFWCSGRSELLKIAQDAPKAAQSRSDSRSGRARGRSEPLRAAQNRSERTQSRSERAQGRRPERSELLSAAQNRSERAQSRSELLRVARSGTAPGRTERAQSCSAPLRIARCVPRAVQSRSESPRAVGHSCSKSRSGSSVSRALCISSAQFCLTWFFLLRACVCTGSH